MARATMKIHMKNNGTPIMTKNAVKIFPEINGLDQTRIGLKPDPRSRGEPSNVSGAVYENPRDEIILPAFQIELTKLQFSGHLTSLFIIRTSGTLFKLCIWYTFSTNELNWSSDIITNFMSSPQKLYESNKCFKLQLVPWTPWLDGVD